MATPTLVTRDVLAALDAAGVRCEVVDTDPNYTTLRFDHVALDLLAEAIDANNADRIIELRHEVSNLRAEMANLRRRLRAAS